MNVSTKWNLVVGIANLALGIYLATQGDFLIGLFCGAAGAYNVAVWKEHRP